MSNPGLYYLYAGFSYPFLYFTAYPCSNYFAGTAQAAFICNAVPCRVYIFCDIIWIDSDDIS